METSEIRQRYRELTRFCAEELEADEGPLTNLLQLGDIEVVLEYHNEAPTQAAGWQAAVDTGEWLEIVKAVTTHCATLIEDDVDSARTQYLSDRAESDWENLQSDPVNYAADLLRTQLAAMVLK